MHLQVRFDGKVSTTGIKNRLLCVTLQQSIYTLALIKSISGIRGTIGGAAGDNLTPQDVVECAAAFGYWLLQRGGTPKVVLGRDGRMSGKMVSSLVANTLVGLGIDVIDLGLSTTPTVEVAVAEMNAGAGIIVTASHNPAEWNALKFLNEKGEFISAADGQALLDLLAQGAIRYCNVHEIGAYRKKEGAIDLHINKILELPLVDAEAVRKKAFKVVVDCVNSTGALSVVPLLQQLGCEVIAINAEVNGRFAHNPEPLPEHLAELSATVVKSGADMGVAVDPDVDRLALVNPDGSMFGEEYTLVAVADYVLQHQPGPTVSNLSSSRALRDVSHRYGCDYFAAAVGEVNVVEKMKAVGAPIGGEGNGGIIVPALHYGRDALAGIALLLSYLARSGKSLLELKAGYPAYFMIKDKIALTPDTDLEKILKALHQHYQNEQCNTEDGLKIDFADGWVHLRKSNTEPIIRIYAEGANQLIAEKLVQEVRQVVSHQL